MNEHVIGSWVTDLTSNLFIDGFDACKIGSMKPIDNLLLPENEKQIYSNWYAEIVTRIPFNLATCEDPASLIDPKQNINEPVYSWFNLKEAFSKEFPSWVLKHLKEKYNFIPKVALDPYCGGGTSLITLRRNNIESLGVEYNPFICWVAHTKTRWEQFDAVEIAKYVRKIRIPHRPKVEIPKLSTLHNKEYFDRNEIKQFVFLQTHIHRLKCATQTKDFLSIGLAAAIEEMSHLKKDGRALRFRKKNDKPKFSEIIKNKWKLFLSHLQQIDKKTWPDQSSCIVYKGSATNLSRLHHPDGKAISIDSNSVDLVLYSPPYLNNFDYSEVYKLELWLLGFITSDEEWLRLRKGTIRSHHSVKFNPTTFLRNLPGASKTALLIEQMASSPLLDERKGRMNEVITGYFDDMASCLAEQFRVLQPGGYLAYNVANSKHGELSIETDLILCEIAQHLGYQPLELIPLREIAARQSKNSPLRESIVILRKPA